MAAWYTEGPTSATAAAVEKEQDRLEPIRMTTARTTTTTTDIEKHGRPGAKMSRGSGRAKLQERER